jgi:hypothetical protein
MKGIRPTSNALRTNDKTFNHHHRQIEHMKRHWITIIANFSIWKGSRSLVEALEANEKTLDHHQRKIDHMEGI